MNISLTSFNTHHFRYNKNSQISSRTHHLFAPMKNGCLQFSQMSPKPSPLSANCRNQLKTEVSMKKDKSNPEAESEEETEEWKEMEKWGGKCIGNEGVVEMMECLEREAIMGDDDGRDPSDYNRRALIFQKSNKVFQGLKENSVISS